MSTMTQEHTRIATDAELTKFGPRLKTQLPGPLATKAIAADDRLISPSYTRSYPLVVKSGRGIRITDVDGNEFLDFAAGIAVNSTGHCHPEGGEGDPGSSCATDPYVRHRFLLREHGEACGAAFSGGSYARAASVLLWQLRCGGCRVRAETRALSHGGGRTSSHFWADFTDARWARCRSPLRSRSRSGVSRRSFPACTICPIRMSIAGCRNEAEQEAYAFGCARYIEERLFQDDTSTRGGCGDHS